MKHCHWKLFLFFLLAACASDKESLKDRTVESIYRKASHLLNDSEYTDAATEFKDIDTLFPYSAKASEGQILAAYCHFLASNYQDSLREIEVFLRYHPSHELALYAMYLKAANLYMGVSSVGRDSKATLEAKRAFVELINKFPNSKYRNDSLRRIIILDDLIAAHEMLIGRFYQKNKNALAAIGRYNFVTSNLHHTNYAPEAYYRILECCSSIGLKEEAQGARGALKLWYPDNTWSKKADLLLKSSL
ncbi:MAG: outer membrane protein assembly factor BamD [Holosporaceae bacterium]|jgi:outer membrane protein assembly factor BamD|nr:outer membrane protein assembly factor BamD [Holosporaceae bacterium]